MNPNAAEAFNKASGGWWSQLHRAAKVRADRAAGFKGKVLARVFEKQKRGLAHVHGVIAVTEPIQRVWAEEYLNALALLAPRYGFGFGFGWSKLSRKFWPGDQAGAYLSSYFVRGWGRKSAITETVRSGDLPHLLVFVSRDLTSATGCTMRSLRDSRRLWASRAGWIEPPRFTYLAWLAAAALLDRRERAHAHGPPA